LRGEHYVAIDLLEVLHGDRQEVCSRGREDELHGCACAEALDDLVEVYSYPVLIVQVDRVVISMVVQSQVV
jgi:hypothetical protein